MHFKISIQPFTFPADAATNNDTYMMYHKYAVLDTDTPLHHVHLYVQMALQSLSANYKESALGRMLFDVKNTINTIEYSLHFFFIEKKHHQIFKVSNFMTDDLSNTMYVDFAFQK
jgi:hypothetical protein